MRSITQNIVVDRLQQALASRGVDLKRTAALEIASEAFGFLDGNAFVAAMKEGRFDPPSAEMLGEAWHNGHRLSVLRDPRSSSLYALETSALPPAKRGVRFGLSPYGGLLQMPEDDVAQNGAPAMARPYVPTGTDIVDPGRIVYIVEEDGTSKDPRVTRWRHLLSRDCEILVDREPVHWMNACRMAEIDGKLYFAITTGEEYDDHEQAVLALRSFETYVQEVRQTILRVGGIINCHDDMSLGRIELEVMLPVKLATDVDDICDWHDAIAILLGADHKAVTATFSPQVWLNDDALDADPEGETDIDVTIEILLMGAKAARAVEDCRDSSDDFQRAILAPDWIREWPGPFYVEVADEIAAYLDDRNPDGSDGTDDWSCDDCGETLQDGSGVCITCSIDSDEDETDEDDRPKDAVCDDCEQTIDYDTGKCLGCGRDWSDVEDRTDAGVLRTVLPDDADWLKRQTDIDDPA